MVIAIVSSNLSRHVIQIKLPSISIRLINTIQRAFPHFHMLIIAKGLSWIAAEQNIIGVSSLGKL